MISLKINDNSYKASKKWTVLETAKHYGIEIPTLCFHEALKPNGACRLCMVEIKNEQWSKLVASCIYKAAEGLNIYTESKRVKNVRRWILEMLLSETPSSSEIIVLAKKYGVVNTRFTTNNPEETCIVCGLCSRACEEIVGVSAISTLNRGVHKTIGSPFFKPTEICIKCGTCVTICPTNAMSKRINSVRIMKNNK